MATILSYQKMQEIKPSSINNKNKMEIFISEVEFGKLQKLLGSDVYNKLVSDCNLNPIPEDVQNILDKGLYKCIAYLTYARYIQESSFEDTFTGMVQKNRTDSNNVSVGALKNVANEYTDMAMMAFDLVKKEILDKYGKTNNNINPNKFSEIQSLRRRNYKCKNTKITYLD